MEYKQVIFNKTMIANKILISFDFKTTTRKFETFYEATIVKSIKAVY